MKFVIESIGLTAGGGKELALDLMTRLVGHTEHQFTFIVPDLGPYKAISGSNICTIVSKKGSGLLHRARLLNCEVPRICREETADALLCLGNFVPRKRVCPTAVLLHNPWIVYRDGVAESHRTRREKLIIAYAKYAYRHLPGNITVITQTPVMKEHLCRRYGIGPGRVAIIPNTFSLAKPEGSGDRAPSGGDECTRPFTFLDLAHYYAHKNIDILVEAVGKLPKYTGKSAKCVITIAPEQHPGAQRLLERLDQDDLTDKIENIGPVPSRMLPNVYQNADALILPTLLESFSRTYLEAMYFGLPILTSNRDFARHLCGDAAIYFDPLDADSVAQAMARVMEDSGLRRRLAANGRRVLAESPSWDEIAARFVEVLERTARGEPPVPTEPHARDAERRLVTAREKESTPGVDAVRTLFNQKARGWQRKYGSEGKLNSRVEQFADRLAALCLPPAGILDFGCGTGDIAAAIDAMGYQVTACDFAEEMIAVARSNYSDTAVKWVRLEPDWRNLPFADQSFAGIVASSVFEYVDDVPQVAQELSRVLRPDGVLLLTVPNPHHVVRKLEARVKSLSLVERFSPLLRTLQRFDSYASYLRLSKNRFAAQEWKSILGAAQFAPLDENEFSDEAWKRQVNAPLILLGVKRTTTGIDTQIDVESALCRHVAG